MDFYLLRFKSCWPVLSRIYGLFVDLLLRVVQWTIMGIKFVERPNPVKCHSIFMLYDQI
jgi:hypothetical protein